MKRKIFIVMVAAMSMGMAAGASTALADDERVYGRDLMSEQERSEQREKMRSMDAGEREQYRAEQHERMQERAREQGKEIPEQMGERGMGQGQGMGRGNGMGMGGGRGR